MNNRDPFEIGLEIIAAAGRIFLIGSFIVLVIWAIYKTLIGG